MRFAVSVMLLWVSAAFWILYVPLVLSHHIPSAVRSYLAQQDTLALLIGFLVVPALLAMSGLVALVTWARVSSWFMSRADFESMIKLSVFGGGPGKFEKRILDRFYGEDRR
jgi:hypothetical protein